MPRSNGDRIRLLSRAAYAGMFVFGIVMALLGAILPSLAGRLQFSLADVGTLFLFMNGAMLASSLVLGLIMDRFGIKLPMALGPLFVAAALVIVINASAFRELLFAVVLLGIGGGALNGATNTLVADLHEDPRKKSAALNMLGVFFGFGALFLPFAIAALLAWLSVAKLLAAAAGLCTAVGVFASLPRFPIAKQSHALPLAAMLRFARAPLVLAFAGLLFFESGVEFTLGGFISSYLIRDAGISSVSIASWILAAYWASIMLSRAVLSRLALGSDPYRILLFCSSGAFIGASLAAVAPYPALSALAIVVCGWSLAGIFPTALGIAGARFKSHSGTVFGILFAVALAGGMIVPWIAGHLGGAWSLRWVFGMVAASFVAIFGLSVLASRIQVGNAQTAAS